MHLVSRAIPQSSRTQTTRAQSSPTGRERCWAIERAHGLFPTNSSRVHRAKRGLPVGIPSRLMLPPA